VAAVVLLVVYTWTIAECGPWDPWETHYGEVARNILGRDDPMDLWWRPGFGPDGKREQSFASKHALPFWCIAVAMWVFRIGDDPTFAGEMVQPFWPELSLRLPGLLGAAIMAATIVWCVRRLAGARAGLLTLLVIATLPQLAITSRQAITDIYFVGPIGGAIAAWAMAWLQPDRELRTRRLGPVELPWDRATTIFTVVLILAAVVPLAVLHQHVNDPDTIRRVSKWSKIPTIPNVGDLRQVSQHLMVYWGLLALILARVSRWRHRRQAWMGLLFVCAGLSFMGKGLLGPGLIGLVILTHLAVTGTWTRLRGCELPIGVLIFAITCVPWHHAMALFREERWVQELLLDNNLTRFASGEQEQAIGSFAFYLKTLGIAALPWSAVIPIALLVAARSFGARGGDGQISPRVQLLQLVTLWFIVSFGVITYSVTKYHHYLVPCLPPLAVVIGLWLDSLLRPDDEPDSVRLSLRGRFVAFGLAAMVLAMVLRWVVAEPSSIAHLTTYLYTGMWRKGAPDAGLLPWLCAPFAIGVLAWVVRRRADAVATMALSALACTTWVLGSYLPQASDHWSQRGAFRTVYANKAPDDPVMSWWFYYRGETFFTKHRIWVSTEPRRDETRAYVEKHGGKGRTAWIMTTADHAKRARNYFPGEMRDGMEVVWENEHYTLLRAPIP
jgi:4-amino-4-deoxy-L-arabinose transferase-like glycosyltransferase